MRYHTLQDSFPSARRFLSPRFPGRTLICRERVREHAQFNCGISQPSSSAIGTLAVSFSVYISARLDQLELSVCASTHKWSTLLRGPRSAVGAKGWD